MNLFNDLKFSKGKKQPQHVFWYFKQTFCCRIVGVLVLVVVRRQPTCYLLSVSQCTKSKRASAENHAGREADFANLDQNPLLLDHGRHLPVLASTSHR